MQKKEAPWYVLIDGLSMHNPTTISGVLGAARNIVVAQQLRRGIMDSYLMPMSRGFDPESKECTGYKTGGFCEMPEHLKTDLFRQKQLLIQVRKAAFYDWLRRINEALVNMRDFPIFADNEIQREIDNSTSERPASGILDYASASGMEPLEAYNFLKLYVDERINKRLMLHALAERFARQINGCRTKEEADAVSAALAKELRSMTA